MIELGPWGSLHKGLKPKLSKKMTEDTKNKEVSLDGLTRKEIKESLRKYDIPDQQLNMRVNQI